MENYQREISAYFTDVEAALKRLDVEEINRAMNAIYRAFQERRHIYVFGNGGSAATASHLANDFNKGISQGLRKKFRVCCLNDNMATVMAIANDLDYSDVFAEQLRNRLEPGDLVIAISGSGNSSNIIKAVRHAKECGCEVIGLSGYDGGRLKTLADYSMHVDVDDMQIVEDLHLVFNHMMMRIFSRRLHEMESECEKVSL